MSNPFSLEVGSITVVPTGRVSKAGKSIGKASITLADGTALYIDVYSPGPVQAAPTVAVAPKVRTKAATVAPTAPAAPAAPDLKAELAGIIAAEVAKAIAAMAAPKAPEAPVKPTK